MRLDVEVVVKPSLSSLPLQVALFYNALFSVIFGMLMGAATIDKVRAFLSLHLFISNLLSFSSNRSCQNTTKA